MCNTIVLEKLTICGGVSYFGNRMSVKPSRTSHRSRALDLKIKCHVIALLSWKKKIFYMSVHCIKTVVFHKSSLADE